MDVILEWRSKAWDIEAEHTVPHFADSASRFRAVRITSGARESLLEYFDTLEIAVKIDVSHDASIGVPDASNVEILCVGGYNGIRISVGTGWQQSHVLLTCDLIDCDAVAWDNISDLLMVVAVMVTLGVVDLDSVGDLRLGGFDKVSKHDFLFNIDSKEFIINN